MLYTRERPAISIAVVPEKQREEDILASSVKKDNNLRTESEERYDLRVVVITKSVVVAKTEETWGGRS